MKMPLILGRNCLLCFLWLSTQPTKRRAYVFRWDWVKFDYRVGWRKYLSQSTQNPVVSCLLGWRVDFSAQTSLGCGHPCKGYYVKTLGRREVHVKVHVKVDVKTLSVLGKDLQKKVNKNLKRKNKYCLLLQLCCFR